MLGGLDALSSHAGSAEVIPLTIADADLSALPTFTLPADHQVHHIFSPQDLASLDLARLLGVSERAPKGKPHVLGFDAEWRPVHSRSACLVDYAAYDQPADVCVVQFSSSSASVVINLLAVGMHMMQEAQV